MAQKPFTFVLISDIHFGADKLHNGFCKKLSSRALSLVRYMVNRINSELRPSFVVQLGDAIEDEDAETDEENYSTIIEAFKPLTMPIYHVVGNKEQVNLSLDHVNGSLNYPKLYYSFDSGDYHFVVLFSLSRSEGEISIDETQLKWLEADLGLTKKKTVIFLHHPLDDQDLSESFWFEGKPDLCFVAERVSVREVIARSGKVIAVFNGHVHRNNLQFHDDIAYITIQSLVENLTEKSKTPSESFAVVTLSKAEIRVEIEGLNPEEYRIGLQ
jgi:predicted phosphodiesterase